MRGFIAINLPAALRPEVYASANALRQDMPGVRWAAAEALHLTLKFLGHVAAERVPELVEAIDAAARGRRPFTLRLRGAGAFPNARRPRVWWIGIDESDALRELHADVESAVESLGFVRERRPFAPHLTIGRTGGEPRRMPEAEAALARVVFDAAFDVASIELMESRLSGVGAQYTRVASAALEGGAIRAAATGREG